tara:strand:- start:86066 stop:86710 length:645 start_codon:yes stop_codon:yes gene_type:complete
MKLILLKVTPLNWVVIVSCLISAFVTWEAAPEFKLFLPVSIASVALNNYVVASWGLDFTAGTALLAFICFLFTVSILLTGKSWEALTNPQIQWWKIPLRVRKSIPVFIEISENNNIMVRTFDISLTGAFLKAIPQDILEERISKGQSLKVHIGLGDDQITIEGIIARKAITENGHYPVGIGVQFLGNQLSNFISLRKILMKPFLYSYVGVKKWP